VKPTVDAGAALLKLRINPELDRPRGSNAPLGLLLTFSSVLLVPMNTFMVVLAAFRTVTFSTTAMMFEQTGLRRRHADVCPATLLNTTRPKRSHACRYRSSTPLNNCNAG